MTLNFLIFLGLISFIFAGSYWVSAASTSKEKGDSKNIQTIAIASIHHSCGGIYYIAPVTASLSGEEIDALRGILSFLYDGGNVLFVHSDSQKPELNAETRRVMSLNNFVREQAVAEAQWRLVREGVISQDDYERFLRSPGRDPSPAELEQEIVHLHSIDPAAWHIHKGSTPSQLQQIIAKGKFSKRAGQNLISLIEERIKGAKGQRRAIIKQLESKFGVSTINNLAGNENCHITDSLGPE